MDRGLNYLYRKLGHRYPRIILVAQFQLAYFIVLGGMGLLALYQVMSWTEFLLLLLGAGVGIFIENLISTKLTWRLLRPADSWLCGERDERTAVTAWRTLTELPVEYMFRRRMAPVFFSGIPWCVYATWVLGLRWYSGLILLAGASVVILYGVALRYFAMELSLRPVLADVARYLPDGFRLGRGGVTMRTKLLVSLPAINIVTGVVVSGLSTTGQATLNDLGLDVLVAVAIAFTTSLELTILLARSMFNPLGELTEATEKVARGDLSVRVPVVSNDETGRLAQSFNNAVAGLAERQRLHEALGSYVDPQVADTVLRSGPEIGGDEVEVSVLFLDIQGFTAFSEQASASEVVELLNRLWERIVPVLIRHGGHANKFVGDGLLGVFGAPDRLPDHADRAVEAAIEIAREVRGRYEGELRVGIGVNSGPVIAGSVGGGGRLDYTVIGDPVNTASRIEAATRQTGDDVLISEATRCLLSRDHGGFVERSEIEELRGKRERVRLHAPAALLEDAEAAPAAAGELRAAG